MFLDIRSLGAPTFFAAWLACGLLAPQSLTAEPQTVQSSAGIQSGRYTIQQSWSQEANFDRPYFVKVPAGEREARLPVLIFLHGNGGRAEGAMRNFVRQYPKTSSQHVTVFPDGYEKSWNIVSERSKANDLEFIEAIVHAVIQHSNVDASSVTVMGNSNGAALVNQIGIESKLTGIRNLISCVSPLNTFQFDNGNFKARGAKNDYEKDVQPVKGRRLLNVSGTTDRLVPYAGGPSPVIPAKDGKLSFVDAEESTYQWAKHFGHVGEKLAEPSETKDSIEVFRYLDGDVVHVKAVDKGHGASRELSDEMLLMFLEGGRKGEAKIGS